MPIKATHTSTLAVKAVQALGIPLSASGQLLTNSADATLSTYSCHQSCPECREIYIVAASIHVNPGLSLHLRRSCSCDRKG